MSILKLIKLIDPDKPNIAERLSQTKLDKIGKQVTEDYKLDDFSRSDWVSRNEEVMELAMQVVKTKTFPWPNAANIKYPLVTMGAISFASRVYPEIIPDSTVVKCKSYGYDQDGSKAKKGYRVSKHMSYQLLVQNKSWAKETDKLLHMLPILGTVFRKVYWDPIRNIPRSELCHPLNVIVNNNATSLDDASRITHRFCVSKNFIVERIRAGLYLDIDLDELESNISDQTTWEYDTDVSPMPENQTGDQPEDDNYELIEVHRYLDLDGDDYSEPYVVIANPQTAKVLAIYPRFDIMEDVDLNEKDQIKRITATQHFIDYHFIPSPDGGFYSLGFGRLLQPLNETINSIMNNLIDSGTLANMQGGFISGLFKIKGGNLRPQMGEFTRVDTGPGVRLEDQIMPFMFKEPSQVLFSLLQFLVGAAKEMASINDVLLGQALPQNSPTGSTVELATQGLKVFNCISKRFYADLQNELNIIFRLNSRYLDQESYFRFFDDPQLIAKDDYNLNELDVLPVADPSLSSESVKQMQVTGLIGLMQTPLINVMNLQQTLVHCLELMQTEDPQKYIMQPDPNPKPSIDEQKISLETAKLKVDAELGKAELQLQAQEIQNKRMQVEIKGNESSAKIQKMKADAMRDQAEAEATREKYDIEDRKVDVAEKKVAVDARKINAQSSRST